MSVRDLMPFGKTPLSVSRGSNPIATFQDEVNRLFSDFFGHQMPHWGHLTKSAFTVSPAMDVSETDKAYMISAELPGLDPKDVQILASDGYVTIKGEKKEEKKEEKEGYFRQERSYGSFQRVVALPETANLDNAEASFRNGVLTLSIPKKAGAHSKERKIEIKNAA